MIRSLAERRGERGLSLVLTMLVLMLLIVVLGQVVHQSQIELDQAEHAVSAMSMRALAEACVQQATAVLMLDLETTGEDAGGAGGDAGGEGLGGLEGGLGGGLFGGGADDGSTGMPLGKDAAEVTSTTDSLLDEWMNPMALQPAMGEGYTLFIEVVDEDSKINLLGLWTEDPDKRALWREVFVRLLDRAFEGTSQDLSAMTAEDLLVDLDDWVIGRRPDDFPVPPLKLSQADRKIEEDAVDTDIFEDDEVHFPQTIEELLFLPGLEEPHIHGFVEDDEFFPGLGEYLTLCSHLELQEKITDDENDPFATSLFAAGSGNPATDDENVDEQQEVNDGLTAGPTNDGLVNANTAPYRVLRALASDNIPTLFLENVVEFRDMLHETRDRLESEIDGRGTFDDWGEDEDGPDEAVDEEDDPARYVFTEPGEVFSKVQEEYNLSLSFAREEDKDAFTSLLTTTSQVFTIKVFLRNDETGRRANFRTVVWRAVTPEGPRMITLRPLHPYVDLRRDEDLPEDLQQINEERFY